MMLAYVVIFGAYSCVRHYTFQTQTWDLAVFEQSFYSTVHGNFMVNAFENGSHFAVHFSPTLLLLVPFYALWQSPYALLLIQSLALGMGALPLYLYTKKILNKRYGLLVGGLYLVYPSLHWINLFDFHAVSFAIPLTLAAWYYLNESKYWLMSVFIILAAGTEENIIVTILFIGLYLLVKRRWRIGSAVTLSSLVYFGLVGYVIMPAFGGGIARLDRYQQFGDTLPAIIAGVITNPVLTAATIATPAKALYLVKLLVPVFFLPLLSAGHILLLIPGLLQNLLTNTESQYASFYHYDSILVPFILIASAHGLKHIFDRQFVSSRILATTVTASAIICLVWLSPLSPINIPINKFDRQRIQTFRQIIKAIPPTASVAVDTNLVPHLTHREHVYLAGTERLLVDFVVIDSYNIIGFPDQAAFDQYLNQYRQSGHYELSIISDRYFVFKRTNG